MRWNKNLVPALWKLRQTDLSELQDPRDCIRPSLKKKVIVSSVHSEQNEFASFAGGFGAYLNSLV